ncbi:hypothetical protein [Paenirhodobacter sp.]|uniref:hypothetical protein n=1 Tax=Paenirhodobacter sp. TaxID=1965326 RepID=UPI003B40D235
MIRRRTLLAAAPALALLGRSALAAPTLLTPETTLLPRKGAGPRIVICGGGWGGLTAARYLRQEIPNADVIRAGAQPDLLVLPDVEQMADRRGGYRLSDP